jgi:hypothetical protein
LNLSSENPVSKFAFFKFNLCRYILSRFSHRRILLAPPVGRMRAATLVRAALALPLPPAEAPEAAAAVTAAAAAEAAEALERAATGAASEDASRDASGDASGDASVSDATAAFTAAAAATAAATAAAAAATAAATAAAEKKNKEMLELGEDGEERMLVYPPEPGYAARFNAALDAALGARAAQRVLQRFEALECTPRAAADLALVVGLYNLN